MVHFLPAKKKDWLLLVSTLLLLSTNVNLFGQAACHKPVDGVFFDYTGVNNIDDMKAEGVCYELPKGTGTMTVCYTYTYPSSGSIDMKYAVRHSCGSECKSGMSGTANGGCSSGLTCYGGSTFTKTYDNNCNFITNGASIGAGCGYVAGQQYIVCFQVALSPTCVTTVCPVMDCSSNQCACPSSLTANAGSDQTFCETSSANLSGNVVPQGSGKWTLVSGPNTPTITSSTTSNTSVTGLVAGTYTFKWTLTCGNKSSSDNVVLTVKPKPVASATFATPVCSGTAVSITLSSTVAGTTYGWTSTASGVSGATPSSTGTPINQTLTYTGNPGTVTYNVTPTANGCAGNVLSVPVGQHLPALLLFVRIQKQTLC